MTTAAQAAFPSASLYVGDLAPDVSEALLFEIFNQVGPVASIRVCRDTVTRRSLGYSYVNFHSVVDAERALDTMNYTPIKGKPCRIMWSHRDPSIRRSGVGNIFIKNLDKTIDNKALYDTFSAFGNILSCKVVTDLDGNSRGYGFVHFETQQAAESAIAKVNGMLLNGKQVFVGPFVRRVERYQGPGDQKWTNVFVKNLPEEIDTDKLMEMLTKYGKITSALVQKDPEGKSKGFGFVNFDEPEGARACVEDLNGQKMGDKELFVGRHQKRAEREAELRNKYEQARSERLAKFQNVNCYVKNLDDQVDDEKLRAEFAAYGDITSAKIMRDEKGLSRGFGFVCFASPEEASRVVQEANGKMINGKPVYVALHQRKDVRRVQLEQQFAQRMQMQQMRMQNGPGGPMGGPGGPPPMYQSGPVFYPQPGAPMPGRPGPGYVYPQQMMGARPRMAPGQAPYPGPRAGPGGVYQAVPGQYPPNMAGMPGQPGGRGRGGPQGQRPRIPGQPGQPGQLPPGAKVGPGQPPMAGMPPGGPIPAGRGQLRQGIKYAPNVRNMQPQVGPGLVPPGAIAAPAPMGMPMMVPPPTEALTPSLLASASPEQQKQMLGERLFPLVQGQQPELAGKITGMLLEMDNSEVLHLIESPEALASKIGEALSVLQQHAPEESA